MKNKHSRTFISLLRDRLGFDQEISAEVMWDDFTSRLTQEEVTRIEESPDHHGYVKQFTLAILCAFSQE